MKKILFLFLLVFLSIFFIACSKELPVGQKVSINVTNSQNFYKANIIKGVVADSIAENFFGTTFVWCEYYENDGLPSGINVFVPLSIANSLRIGDTLCFARTEIHSEDRRSAGYIYIGSYYDENVDVKDR